MPGLTSHILLTISCKDLVSKDYTSKSDPICIVYERAADGAKQEVGRTEWIKDCKDPVFQTRIDIQYLFEKKQRLVFDVRDVDDPKKVLDGDEIGSIECTLSKIIGSVKGKLTDKLKHSNGKETGSITIMSEEQGGRDKDLMYVEMRGVKLANKDGFMGKSDPYVKLIKLRKDGQMTDVHRTETIDNDLNPKWKPFTVSMKDLCNGKQDEKFKLECWDEDTATKDDMIGWIETTFNELAQKKTVGLNDRPGGNTKEPGSITVDRIHIIRYPTLYDYISNGCELTVSVAIDFTMSNGDPADPNSLHYIRPDGSLNQYEQAMIGVGEILVEYDQDKKIAVYGFGGIVAGHSEASHCFPLNGNMKDPEVLGVDGLLAAYRSAISSTKLYGPTNFAPVIQQTIMHARECKKQAYHVLLILTDGDITDKQETIKAIVQASHEPMSVIIVGVGEETFEEMVMLDGDNGRLVDESGKASDRDIVQFVPFVSAKSKEDLASKVLGELPAQLLKYMCKHQRVPASWANSPYVLPGGDWARGL
ncbi:hypothetical protein GUITHDRAFT_98757 [Guillardia theta CCMP2712]|uniref:C2 domain-containing protein n=1 Tax=Guillardia theta (strain CCMP2712) TaxID=905079 RepID=L1I614_GUITC|nr:hypothetical protein GUITHDRAFT_98757 [Guillardia theta CCMP2712]EKX31691.1 hypothetical protein GUITHDRAFT_98757 [Guillardia theta CCMP2712]|eukprot:XP_005818671.1 hypothetical protein GUITHDRAFT_98757 [Guillardia theta CCMP2712]